MEQKDSDVTASFREEELRDMDGGKHKAGGDLRNGDLFVSYDCTPGCQEDKLTPSALEKHSGRETTRKWKNNVWVIVNGEKVPLGKTVLLKYFEMALKSANGSVESTARFRSRG